MGAGDGSGGDSKVGRNVCVSSLALPLMLAIKQRCGHNGSIGNHQVGDEMFSRWRRRRRRKQDSSKSVSKAKSRQLIVAVDFDFDVVESDLADCGHWRSCKFDVEF